MDDEKTIYRLMLTVVIDSHREVVWFDADDLSDLEPTTINRNGFFYERYGPDDDYTEVRQSSIHKRVLIERPPDRKETDPAADEPPQQRLGLVPRTGAQP